MFDFSMSEVALIGVVALVLIGPKDLPVAVKAVTAMIKKARRMAGEFQSHVDEMVKDADLGDLKDTLHEIRNFDIKGLVEKHVDGDGSLREALSEDPFNPASAAIETETPIAEPPAIAAEPRAPGADDYLAFLPPEIARPPEPPAFLPPGITLHRSQ